MAVTLNYDLDIDSTLGGDNASDYVIPSQKAIKDYVDNNTGSTVDQVYDPTSQAAQSGIAIAGANFLTSSDLANYVTTNTDQNITGVKTYVGQKRIGFKQSGSNDKLGFTLYNNSNVEKGYLEFNPTNTIDSAPLMTLGNYATSATGITHVGFRKYSSVSGASGAYNLLAPLISNAKTPFNLTTTYTNFYLPLGFTDGTTMVKTASSGVVDLSSILPDVSNFVTNSSLATTLADYVTNSSLATTLTDYVTNSALTTTLEDYQPLLVSGTSIKTINNTSLLGSGNIAVGTVTSVNNVSPVNGNVSLTIPTVNNATLTIQKNGTTVKTFTANASTDVTANITVPTKISDLTDDTSTTPIDKADYATSAGTASSATTASTLGSTDVGSATQGIYLDDGTPKACTYTVSKSVPSDAVFTDTKVTQSVSSTNSTYPILLCPTANATTDQGATTSIFASGVKVNPSTKTITATTFDGNATTATTASKLGSADKGSATQPIYLSGGAPTACTYTLAKSVPSDAVFTDTNTLMTQNVSSTNATYPILLCPTANATVNQGAKTGIFASGVKVNPSTSTISATFSGNLTGNVTGNCSGSSGSCTGNAATATYATSAGSATSATSATTATKLGSSTVGGTTTPIYLDGGTPTPLSYTIAKSVPSNAVFTDTTYANGTGITIGTGNAINHSNSVTAATAGTSSATSGSTLAVPYVTYDAQGHVTASGTHTHTVTGFSTTDTKNTAGSTDTSSKIFLVGATSQAANPQTYSHDTAFVDTSGQLNSANPSASTNSTVVATTKWVTDKGYTTNTGTVTSVNNVSPVNGNVSLTIPTVNNATLTIQKNGTTVNTFTANASSNVTANIEVPNYFAGGNISIDAVEKVTLPSGYTQVAYIESTGTQYIDTGWKYNSTYPIIIDCKFIVNSYLGGSGGYPVVYGLQTASYSNWIYPFYVNAGNFNPHIGGSAGIDSVPCALGQVYDTSFTISNGIWSRTINGTNTLGTWSGSITNTANMFLFGGSYGTNPINQLIGKIFSFKITVNGSVVRNYIPCKRNSDGVAGMYDLATSTFKPSASGSFLMGSDVTASGEMISATVTSSTITNALGYTPYNGTTNPNGYITSSSVGNATITITQGGVSKGTFTTNQSSNATIALDAGGTDVNIVKQQTAGTIPFLYAWYYSGATPEIIYTIVSTITSGSIYNCYNSNGELIGIGQAGISNLIYNNVHYSRSSDNDVSLTMQTLTDNNSNALNIVQADGEFIPKHKQINCTTSVGSYSADISDYLPDSTNSYIILVDAYVGYNSSTSRFAVGTIESPYTNGSYGTGFVAFTIVTSNARSEKMTFWLPMGTGRTLYYQTADASNTNTNIALRGYRRVGTNK